MRRPVLCDEVTEVRVEIVCAGARRAAIFLSRDKIASLVGEAGSLGAFLRDMVRAPALDRADEERV